MLIQQFQEYIHSRHLFTKADHLLIAVSGGIDSVVLCDLCFKAGYQFEIAHCNFQLRGEDSERDEQFVRDLSHKYGVKIHVKRFETEEYAVDNKVSIQVAARELRYEWFGELLRQQVHEPLQFILTAHHADDNIETLLMNFFKGTGMRGLQAILAKKSKLVRPLLFVFKEELIEYGKQHSLQFVEDASNFSNKYTRNYFRNVLIPGVEEVFPKVKQNLISNIERFGEAGILYREAVEEYKKKLMEFKGNEVHMPVLKLQKMAAMRTILFEVIQDFGFSPAQVEEVVQLMGSESGHYISSATHRIVKNRGWLIITPLAVGESNFILFGEGTKKVVFPGGVLEFMEVKGEVDFRKGAPEKVHLDHDKMAFPLILRPWRQGDYFYPLGLKKKSGRPGKKKLSKFFVDLKLSIAEKERVWVLESKKQIVWVVGLRADERFKISESTKKVLVVRVE